VAPSSRRRLVLIPHSEARLPQPLTRSRSPPSTESVIDRSSAPWPPWPWLQLLTTQEQARCNIGQDTHRTAVAAFLSVPVRSRVQNQIWQLEANLFIHLFLRALTCGPPMSVTRAETPSGVKYPRHVCIVSALSAPSGPARQPLWLAFAW
jgi:hypothetical protein